MITPERIDEIKELFQDLARQSSDYYELEDYVQSMQECGEITDEEYDFIVEHWDEWLPPEEECGCDDEDEEF